MVPAGKVVTLDPKDSIRKALDLMMEKKIGAIVVITQKTPLAISPLGIVTKTDLVSAYKNGLTLDHPVEEIMSKNMGTCLDTMDRDQAAKVLEDNKNHHAIVVNKDGDFLGLISSWDITVEVARDHRAWPWNRPEDGHFGGKNQPTDLGTSPTSTAEEAHIHNAKRDSHIGDSFRAMIDNLGYVDM